MKIKPLADRVVIKLVEEEETQGRQSCPAPPKRSPRLLRSSQSAPAANVDGKEVEMIVKVGDKGPDQQVPGTGSQGRR